MNEVMFSFSETERQIFRKLSVGALILFGSHTQGRAGTLSDYDIGVIVEDKSTLRSPERRKEIYDALYGILSAHINQLVDIDIVFLEDAPYELRAHVMKHGKVLFESRSGVFADFKESTMIHYADFAPLRKLFQEGVLSRIK
jgi:Predicted nucleotidyltransferases